MSALAAVPPDPIRVIVVDDHPDVRMLLRVQLDRDPRFSVIGEAADGREAIVLAEAERPDLVVLDRRMPRMGGMEAIPEIRLRVPDAAIVLYTANADPGTVQAATDAGALDVLEKASAGGDFVDQLVTSILDRVGASDQTMEVRVGPVSARAAKVWVKNTRAIIDAVGAHPEVLGEPIPDDVLALFRSFLDQWEVVARNSDEFRWVARARADEVERVVGHWARIDALTDEQLDRLGIRWSPPEGEPFFKALTSGVLEALRRHEGTRRLAARLDEQWTS